MKLKGGILAYTLAISLVISIILTSIILLGYYHRLESRMFDIGLKLDRNVASAVQLALADPEAFDLFDPQTLDLYGRQEDTVTLLRRPWGVYDLFHIEARHGRFTRQSVFTIGYEPSEEARAAIYLVDERRPMSVSGSTKLVGHLLVPQSGIQSAYVGRVGYLNDSLYYGTTAESGDELPEFNDPLLAFLDRMDEFEQVVRLNSSLPVDQGFRSDTLIQIQGASLVLSDTIEGFVHIEARGRVTFDSLARTRDVVVQAEVIELNSGFEGSGQFFATDTIIVHKGVKLDYPSLLFVHNDSGLGQIYLESGSEVTGLAGIYGDPEVYFQRAIYLEDGAKFTGAMYCNGFLETYGSIYGHVTVRKTLVNSPSAVYENYLYNALIDGSEGIESLLMPKLWFYSGKKSIMQWL
ncbi:MAG: hypothetical protein AAGA85_22920 [Bacteroidota bacterium]